MKKNKISVLVLTMFSLMCIQCSNPDNGGCNESHVGNNGIVQENVNENVNQDFSKDITPESNASLQAVPTSGSNRPVFRKTSYKCKKCSCSGYWGYQHQNGRFEGNCSNRDKWGHTCGHSPEYHGLKSW